MLILQLGMPPSDFFGGNETAFRYTRSPNSRCRLSFKLNNRTQTKHKNIKRRGLTPAQKIKEKKGRHYGIMGSGVAFCAFILPSKPQRQKGKQRKKKKNTQPICVLEVDRGGPRRDGIRLVTFDVVDTV
jgi:hypothetical protein